MRRPPPAFAILLIAPFVGEVLSTATSIFEFPHPLVLVSEAALYGGGALLIREVARRRGLRLLGLLLLGAAYGIYEEALLVRSWFAPEFMPNAAASAYSRVWETNVLEATHLTLFHAAVSIGCSIAIVELLYPARQGEAWASKLWLFVAAVMLAALVPLTLLPVEGFFTPRWPQMAAAGMLASVVIAVALRCTQPVTERPDHRSRPRPARRPTSLALVTLAAASAHFFIVWLAHLTPLPWPAGLALALAVAWGGFWIGLRVAPLDRDLRRLGAVVGLVLPLVLVNVALGWGGRPDALITAAVGVGGLVWVWRRTVAQAALNARTSVSWR